MTQTRVPGFNLPAPRNLAMQKIGVAFHPGGVALSAALFPEFRFTREVRR